MIQTYESTFKMNMTKIEDDTEKCIEQLEKVIKYLIKYATEQL